MAASPKCKDCILCLDENVACRYEVICEPETKAELFIRVSNYPGEQDSLDEEASEARMDIIGSKGNDGLHYGLTSQEVLVNLDVAIAKSSVASSGSSASYYSFPSNITELQGLISFLNCNAQLGEIGRAWMRYGRCPHSSRKRDLEKIIFYAQAELERIAKYES